MSEILLDLTEFISNPIRTGIQRVVRELVTHWNGADKFVPVEFDAGRNALIPIDEAALGLAVDFATNPYVRFESLKRDMEARDRSGAPMDIGHRTVFVPEVFYDHSRARYHRQLQKRGVDTAFIVYDLLPWVRPDHFKLRHTAPHNFYLAVLANASRRCFISEPVRQEFFQRVLNRDPKGDPALPLGNDGLRLPRPTSSNSAKSDYLLCAGAFDGRKSQDLVLEAFLSCPEAAGMKLVFAGRVPNNLTGAYAEVVACRDPRVQIVDDPGDAELAQLVQNARAQIFVSELEGYGLPATEALFVGVPAVVNRRLPAVYNLPDRGQIRLEATTTVEIRRAMAMLAKNATVSRLAREALELPLPTWKDYAAAVSNWISSPTA